MKLCFALVYLFIVLLPNPAFGSGNMEVGTQSTNKASVGNNPSGLSMKEQYEAGHWIIKPSNNMLTIIGVSNPMIRRHDEIAAAKEDAARKAAMYFLLMIRKMTFL